MVPRRALLALPLLAAQGGRDPELVRLMNQFAKLWNEFILRATFDLKLAKKISKAWREIESSGHWPRD